jgi:mono/diheme cytochrome c family protein
MAEHDGLAAAGNSCGGCHVRGDHRFGPPERGSSVTGPSAETAPHGGFVRTTYFEQSEFCSSCHQFAADSAVNGKPLENTFVEWQNSPQAAAGTTCQSCHMPNRQHLWRGIHDPDMVASGLTPHVTADAERVRFEIGNTGIGHAFPTYTTPKVTMHAVALDANGAPLLETSRSHQIAREVRNRNDRWIELSDTRLLPGQSAALEIPWGDSTRVKVWLEIAPDNYYETEVYPALVQALQSNPGAQQLILKASANAAASHFRLFETELRKP